MICVCLVICGTSGTVQWTAVSQECRNSKLGLRLVLGNVALVQARKMSLEGSGNNMCYYHIIDIVHVSFSVSWAVHSCQHLGVQLVFGFPTTG